MHSVSTERLLIRPLAEHDKALYLSLYTDAKVMRNIGEPLPIELAEKAFCNTLKAMKKLQCKVLTWAIVNKLNDQVIGIQVLNFNDKKNGKSAEVGIMLSTKMQNSGIGKEAISALLQYSFSKLSLDIITVLYSKENIASDKLFSRLNFILAASPSSLSDSQEEKSSIEKRWLYKKPHVLC